MFPIGGFSFSCGLESAVQTRVVHDRVTLHAFARTAREQAARGDGIALVAAHRAAKESDVTGDVEALIAIDRQVFARKPSDETRTMSRRMGRKFTELGVEVVGAPLIRTCLRAHHRRRDVRMLSGRARCPFRADFWRAASGPPLCVATAILGAALRLMRVSHVDNQAILYDLNAGVDAAYETASAARLPTWRALHHSAIFWRPSTPRRMCACS
jgi:urease accessory protein